MGKSLKNINYPQNFSFLSSSSESSLEGNIQNWKFQGLVLFSYRFFLNAYSFKIIWEFWSSSSTLLSTRLYYWARKPETLFLKLFAFRVLDMK